MNASRSLLVLALAVVPAAFGCDATKGVPLSKTPSGAPATGAHGDTGAPTLTSAAMLPPGVDASVQTASLHVSDEIARACGLPKPQVTASFGFDSTAITEDDRVMLAAIAKCLTEGPLKGRNVSLIGRADPRGEDEYNMSLGGTRSESVRRYMHDLGVENPRLSTTSRGELDASGKDEESWARDRRVDVELTK